MTQPLIHVFTLAKKPLTLQQPAMRMLSSVLRQLNTDIEVTPPR